MQQPPGSLEGTVANGIMGGASSDERLYVLEENNRPRACVDALQFCRQIE